MQITDENQIKIFVKFIQDINQYLKNIYGSEPYYNYENGNIICNGDNQVTPYVTAQPKYTKKNAELKSIIDNVSFTMFGIGFFQFLKEYKNNINKIVIESNYITFETDLPLVSLTFNKVKINNKPYNNTYEELASFNLTENQASLINDLGNSPFILYLDFNSESIFIDEELKGNEISTTAEEEKNFLELIFNKKFLVGFKSTKTSVSDISIAVYDFDSDNNLYLLEMKVDSKEILTKQYMVITDVLDNDEK